MGWISYHHGYAGGPFTERDLQRWAARHPAADRRADRARIGRLPDGFLEAEMADAEGWLRSVASPGSFTGYAATLRMARHEAVVMRGWDAHDPRVRWEPREFAGPLDEAAYQAGLAAVGLSAGWHDSLYPSPGQAEAARRDAAQACGLVGGAIGELDRVRGTLARLLRSSSPAPGYPRGELAEASLRFTLAGESIRASLHGLHDQDETLAVAAARRFRDMCSGLAAVLDDRDADSADADSADAVEALAKIGTITAPVKNYASSVRSNLKELAPKARPSGFVTWRDWDPAAARELARAWQALNAWEQTARSAEKARARRAGVATQPPPGHPPAVQAGSPGFPAANPLAPPGPRAATGQRTSPATTSASRARTPRRAGLGQGDHPLVGLAVLRPVACDLGPARPIPSGPLNFVQAPGSGSAAGLLAGARRRAGAHRVP